MWNSLQRYAHIEESFKDHKLRHLCITNSIAHSTFHLSGNQVRLIDLEEVERQKLADAQTDLARVAENLENAAGERATMQQELQATKKRLVEAYDEQLDKKRLIKKTAEDLDLQNTQLEEQKTKLKDMVDRRYTYVYIHISVFMYVFMYLAEGHIQKVG